MRRNEVGAQYELGAEPVEEQLLAEYRHLSCARKMDPPVSIPRRNILPVESWRWPAS